MQPDLRASEMQAAILAPAASKQNRTLARLALPAKASVRAGARDPLPMRSSEPAMKPPTHSTDAPPHDADALREEVARVAAAMTACEALGDDALARQAGRKLFAAVACAADALLRDGGQGLRAAPEKVGAFFDKAAAGFVQALDGMHRRAVLKDAALACDAEAPRPRAADPLAPAFAAWAPPARGEAERPS
jgi:hypothetical protein